MRSRFTLLVTLILLAPVRAAAQTAECPTSDCLARPQTPSTLHQKVWADAGAVHAVKLEFVSALQRFLRAQAGVFGDEGDELRAAVDAMRQSLTRWDAGLDQFLTATRRLRADAETHLALATVLLDRQRADEALKELDLAARQDPDRADIYSLQGLAFGLSGRALEAARAWRKASEIDASAPASSYQLAQALARVGQQEESVRALQQFQRALTRLPGAAPGTRATAPFERVDLLKQAPGVAPIFAGAPYVSGFEALETGDYATAVTRWEQAAAHDTLLAGEPSARSAVVQAASLVRSGKLAAAIQLLEASVASSPDQAEPHRLLGLAYWIDGQQGRGIDHVRTAITLEPHDERPRLLLADVLVDERRLSEAERVLTLAVESGIRSGQIAYRLARLYERQSLLPQAASAFRDSARFGPVAGRDFFFQVFGSLLVNQADFDAAIEAYRMRIESNPNNGQAHRQLGEIYFLQGRHEEALAEFMAAIWLDPSDARAHAAAGQTWVRLLKYAEAVVAFERALALDSSLREARYGLGTSLARLGRADDAAKALEAFAQQQAEAEERGRREFQLDALRREASRELLSGDSSKAIGLLEEALSLEADSARSHRDLGLALARAGRPAEAVTQLEQAQRIEETPEGYAYLADAELASGHAEEAQLSRARYRAAVQQQKLDRIEALAR